MDTQVAHEPIPSAALSDSEVALIDAYWQACKYL